MNDMVVAQLHSALVDAIRRTRPDALDRPVTVAEIYQDLVPYRNARTAFGFEMNADYEHALLRLLAGEGDFARIEPREVRDKLRMELEAPNPDVGLFRNYAACDVWVSFENEAAAADGSDQGESWEEEFLGPDEPVQRSAGQDREPDPVEVMSAGMASQHSDDDVKAAEEEETPSRHSRPAFQIATPEPAEAVETSSSQTVEEAPACIICGGELPVGRPVNFCPYCGGDQSQQPCPTCGELLEPLWRFCVACGARVRQAGDHVN